MKQPPRFMAVEPGFSRRDSCVGCGQLYSPMLPSEQPGLVPRPRV